MMLVWGTWLVEISTYQTDTCAFRFINGAELEMEDYNSETDSDYTSYWRDWVCNSSNLNPRSFPLPAPSSSLFSPRRKLVIFVLCAM